jgi:CheY-like chemotaxis protein
MPEERQRCLVLGMNGHLGKPIDPAVLYETLADLQARRARTRPGPTTAPVANAAQFA